MKNRFLTSLLFAATASTAIAQQTNHLSIISGSSYSSSDTKKHAYTGNGYNMQADVFIPFLHLAGSYANNAGKFALGVTAGGSYSDQKILRRMPAVRSLHTNYTMDSLTSVVRKVAHPIMDLQPLRDCRLSLRWEKHLFLHPSAAVFLA